MNLLYETRNARDPFIERLLDEEGATLVSEGKRLGKLHGPDNKPELEADTFEPLIEPLRARAERLRSRIIEHAKPEVRAAQAHVDLETAKKDCAEIDTRIADLMQDNRVLRHEIDGRTPPKPLSSLRYVYTAIAYIGDIAFNVMTFQYLNHSLLASLGLAALVALCTEFCARLCLYFIGKREAWGNRAYLAAGAVAAVLISAFHGLSLIRSGMSGETDAPTSAWIYLMFNIMVFIAILGIRFFFFSQNRRTEAERNLMQLCEREAANEKEIMRLKAEKNGIENRYKEKMFEHMRAISIASHAVERAGAFFKESVAEFKSANLLTRKDRGMPQSFEQRAFGLDPMAPIQQIPVNLPN